MTPAGSETTTRLRPPLVPLALLTIGLAAVLLAALGHRLAVDRAPGPDDSLYASEAVRWLAGQPLTTMSGDPAAVRPPIYVLALAGATSMTGDWQLAERTISAVSLFAAVAAVAAIAWAVAGIAAAVLAVGLFIVPGAVEAFARSAIDGTQAALSLAAVAVGLIAARRGEWTAASAAVVGVGLGLAVLTKETALALAPWPALFAFTQPSGSLRAPIRWAAIATASTAIVLLPWWLWVDLSVGTLFPTRIGGVRAHLGVAALAAAGVAAAAASSPWAVVRLAALIGRIGEPRRWWLAIGFAALWAAAIVVAFLSSDARHGLSRLPPLRATLESVISVLGLVLLPVVAVPALVIAILAAPRQPRLRGLLHVLLLTGGIVIIVLIKNWDPRSALVPALALGLLVPIAAVAAARRMATLAPPQRRGIAAGVLCLMAIAVFSSNVAGVARAIQDPPRPTDAQRWNGPVVRQAADWLAARLSPGDTVVASWLFATSLDAFTGGRFVIEETPTIQARIGRAREPVLVPTGTLFRETAHLPPTIPTDWLFVRRHPSEGYLVALSGTMLGDTIVRSGAKYLVLSGEHPAQSTATIATTIETWPGVDEVARFASGDAEILILSIDQASFQVGPFPTQLNAVLLREWRSIVRLSRRGSEPGDALCELLAGRPLEVVPDDDRVQQAVADLVPLGCPLVPAPSPVPLPGPSLGPVVQPVGP